MLGRGNLTFLEALFKRCELCLQNRGSGKLLFKTIKKEASVYAIDKALAADEYAQYRKQALALLMKSLTFNFRTIEDKENLQMAVMLLWSFCAEILDSPLFENDEIIAFRKFYHLFDKVREFSSDKLCAQIEIFVTQFTDVNDTNKYFNLYIDYCSDYYYINLVLSSLKACAEITSKDIGLKSNKERILAVEAYVRAFQITDIVLREKISNTFRAEIKDRYDVGIFCAKDSLLGNISEFPCSETSLKRIYDYLFKKEGSRLPNLENLNKSLHEVYIELETQILDKRYLQFSKQNGSSSAFITYHNGSDSDDKASEDEPIRDEDFDKSLTTPVKDERTRRKYYKSKGVTYFNLGVIISSINTFVANDRQPSKRLVLEPISSFMQAIKSSNINVQKDIAESDKEKLAVFLLKRVRNAYKGYNTLWHLKDLAKLAFEVNAISLYKLFSGYPNEQIDLIKFNDLILEGQRTLSFDLDSIMAEVEVFDFLIVKNQEKSQNIGYQIELAENHLPLKKGFKWDLPRFSIVTGYNGSGKTRLLQYLEGQYRANLYIDAKHLQLIEKTFNIVERCKEERSFEEICSDICNTGGFPYKTQRATGFPIISLLKANLEVVATLLNGKLRGYEAKFQVKCGPKRKIDNNKDYTHVETFGQKGEELYYGNVRESKVGKKAREVSDIDIYFQKDGDKNELRFADLSSGEKVLFTLISCIVANEVSATVLKLTNAVTGIPSLILMDEIDTHFHPDYTQQLFRIMKEFKAANIVITTHNPATIALAEQQKDEVQFFFLNDNENRIELMINARHAISKLSNSLLAVIRDINYVLVENKDDAKFYSMVYAKFASSCLKGSKLIFVPVGIKKLEKDFLEELVSHADDLKSQLSERPEFDKLFTTIQSLKKTNDQGGGCGPVKKRVNIVEYDIEAKDGIITKFEKPKDNQIHNSSVIFGLLDRDKDRKSQGQVHAISVYSFENYLCMPLSLLYLEGFEGAEIFINQLKESENDEAAVVNAIKHVMGVLKGKVNVKLSEGENDPNIKKLGESLKAPKGKPLKLKNGIEVDYNEVFIDGFVDKKGVSTSQAGHDLLKALGLLFGYSEKSMLGKCLEALKIMPIDLLPEALFKEMEYLTESRRIDSTEGTKDKKKEKKEVSKLANAFNQCANQDYYYQAVDMLYIGSRIAEDNGKAFIGVLGNNNIIIRPDAFASLSSEAAFGIYRDSKGLWLVFSVASIDSNIVLEYESTLEEGNNFESLIKQYNIDNYNPQYKPVKVTRKNDSYCGIIALKSLYKICCGNEVPKGDFKDFRELFAFQYFQTVYYNTGLLIELEKLALPQKGGRAKVELQKLTDKDLLKELQIDDKYAYRYNFSIEKDSQDIRIELDRLFHRNSYKVIERLSKKEGIAVTRVYVPATVFDRAIWLPGPSKGQQKPENWDLQLKDSLRMMGERLPSQALSSAIKQKFNIDIPDHQCALKKEKVKECPADIAKWWIMMTKNKKQNKWDKYVKNLKGGKKEFGTVEKTAYNQYSNNKYLYQENDLTIIGSVLTKDAKNSKFIGVVNQEKTAKELHKHKNIEDGEKVLGIYNAGEAQWVAFCVEKTRRSIGVRYVDLSHSIDVKGFASAIKKALGVEQLRLNGIAEFNDLVTEVDYGVIALKDLEALPLNDDIYSPGEDKVSYEENITSLRREFADIYAQQVFGRTKEDIDTIYARWKELSENKPDLIKGVESLIKEENPTDKKELDLLGIIKINAESFKNASITSGGREESLFDILAEDKEGNIGLKPNSLKLVKGLIEQNKLEEGQEKVEIEKKSASKKPQKSKKKCKEEPEHNAFNEYYDQGYEYQTEDMVNIGNQVIQELREDGIEVSFIGVLGKGKNAGSISAQQFLENYKQEIEEKKVVVGVGVYNTGGRHWIAFSLIPSEKVNTITLLYKDSLGIKRGDLESVVNKVFPKQDGWKVEIKRSTKVEQIEPKKVNCGLFALKNMEIMRREIAKSKENSINEFDKSPFYDPSMKENGYDQTIRELREEFAAKYAKAIYEYWSVFLKKSKQERLQAEELNKEKASFIDNVRSKLNEEGLDIQPNSRKIQTGVSVNRTGEEKDRFGKYRYVVKLIYKADSSSDPEKIKQLMVEKLGLEEGDYEEMLIKTINDPELGDCKAIMLMVSSEKIEQREQSALPAIQEGIQLDEEEMKEHFIDALNITRLPSQSLAQKIKDNVGVEIPCHEEIEKKVKEVSESSTEANQISVQEIVDNLGNISPYFKGTNGEEKEANFTNYITSLMPKQKDIVPQTGDKTAQAEKLNRNQGKSQGKQKVGATQQTTVKKQTQVGSAGLQGPGTTKGVQKPTQPKTTLKEKVSGNPNIFINFAKVGDINEIEAMIKKISASCDTELEESHVETAYKYACDTSKGGEFLKAIEEIFPQFVERMNKEQERQKQELEVQGDDDKLVNSDDESVSKETENNSQTPLGSGGSGDQHLKRIEKSNLIKSIDSKTQYNLHQHLIETNLERKDLDRLDKVATEQGDKDFTQTTERSSVQLVTRNRIVVTMLPENDHLIDHNRNALALLEAIESGKIQANTVIALERKQYGTNLGIQDVIKLASIISHNENSPADKIAIPKEVENSLIYQDARLYNLARIKGIQVIGAEGKSLAVSKGSPLYNEVREEYMASRLIQLVSSGYNVIFPVGSVHIKGLKSRLEAMSTMVLIQETNKENVMVMS
jgi:energy-coupling factor transporter ATP-binding protein EcfA2